MKKNTKIILSISAIAIAGYLLYKRSNYYVTKRLKSLGVSTDLSKFDNDFLRTWMSKLEKFTKNNGTIPANSNLLFIYGDKTYRLIDGKADNNIMGF